MNDHLAFETKGKNKGGNQVDEIRNAALMINECISVRKRAFV